MAKIINQDGNLELNLSLKKNNLLDYEKNRSDYENWLPFTLYVKLPNKYNEIDESVKATMTVFEINDFINGFENVLRYLKEQKKYIYRFNSSEAFFELNLEGIPEDKVIEMELWINVGSQTLGKISGFDDGVRWVSDIAEVRNFLEDIKTEFNSLILEFI